MKFENSDFCKKLNYTKIKVPFGVYYFCDKFVIGELNEGVHLDWEKAELTIRKVIEFYGTETQIGFITNRINNYSLDPNNWRKVDEKYNLFIASAIVMYNNSTYMNASIEKQFTEKRIKRCISLKEAIEWLMNLKEFN